jgi:hypothetical protein
MTASSLPTCKVSVCTLGQLAHDSVQPTYLQGECVHAERGHLGGLDTGGGNALAFKQPT